MAPVVRSFSTRWSKAIPRKSVTKSKATNGVGWWTLGSGSHQARGLTGQHDLGDALIWLTAVHELLA